MRHAIATALDRHLNLIRSLIPTRYWTRHCDGNCGNTDPHDAHLTALGRVYFATYRRAASASQAPSTAPHHMPSDDLM